MIFQDNEVAALDLSVAASMQELIEIHLCGHPRASPLSDSDSELLEEFVSKAATAGMTFQQLNELLLVLNQDRLSRAFFDFFLSANTPVLSMEQLKSGVVRFKGFAMVCFGNFRFAYRQLSTIHDPKELCDELGPCCRECDEIDAAYANRAEKVLDVTSIARQDTWYVGEVTGTKLKQELTALDQHLKDNPDASKDEEVKSFAKRLTEMDDQFKTVQKIALRNTDVYLTWDHVDVYVATSMRNRWEYEEVHEFTHDLFTRPILTDLKLRYFDPTQSKCRTRLDKGLLEGSHAQAFKVHHIIWRKRPIHLERTRSLRARLPRESP